MARKKRNKGAKPDLPPTSATGDSISSRYRFFLWMSGFFALATLFLRADVITVWPGAEGWALYDALGGGKEGFFLPSWINAQLSSWIDPFYLAPRLLSATFLLATAFLIFRWGRKLFGLEAARLTLLLAAAGLWLPFFGKVATPDSWALFGHTGIFLSSLLYARAKHIKYGYYLLGFVVFSSLAAPMSTLILVIGLAIFAIRGKVKKEHQQLLAGAVGIAVLARIVIGWPDFTSYYFLGTPSLDAYIYFLLYAFLGALPQVGWWLAGQRDWFFRLKKGDVLAKSLLPFILMALLSQSLLLIVLWSLLSAKQIQNYFAERYPWKSWVRAGAILQLIGAFFAAFLGLLAGLAAFRGDGYRAALGMVAAYWIFSLLAVIGLYGNKRDFAIGGTILAGILGSLFFWTQVYPYIETQRDWPQQAIEQFDLDKNLPVYLLGDHQTIATGLPYFREQGFEEVFHQNIGNTERTKNFQRVIVRPILTADSILQSDQFIGRTVIRGVVVEQ